MRVVIVEDSSLVREHLTEILAATPGIATVGHADAADAALAVIDRERPDAVILDLGLRAGSGMAVLAQLPEPKPVVLVLTNYSHDEYRRQCAALGAHAFFDKSSEFDQVVPALLRLMPVRGTDPAPA